MNGLLCAPTGWRLAIFFCLAGMCPLGGLTAARSPISLEVLHRRGYGSVELLKDGQNRLVVPAEINGRKIRLLLDTGWGGEGISLGINPSEFQIVPEKGGHMTLSASGAQVPMGQGTARSVVMGNVHIKGTPISFGRVSEAGVVSRGFLKRNSAIIDLTNLRLYLRPRGTGRPVDLSAALTALGMAKVSFVEAHGLYVLNVEVNGQPTQMALDTGAQMTVLDRRFAQLASTRGWGRRDVYQVDAAGVRSETDLAGTKTFKIEGVPIRTPTVFLAKFIGYDVTRGKLVGVLGLDVIGMNWGIIDVAQRKFYFTQAR